MFDRQKKVEAAQHRVALVTGGSGGIGFAIATMFLEEGIRTLVADVQKPVYEAANLFYHQTDICSAASIDSLYTYIQQEQLVPDLIICNAGRGIQERLAEGDPEKWLSIFNLNVMGHLRTIRSFLPQMLEKEHTTDIVFISSVAARKPHEWGGIYAASKAALQSLAETLRLEVQPKVRVSTILPGIVQTQFFENMIGGSQSAEDIGWGSLSPQDIAEAVYYIVSRPPGVAVNELVIRPAAQPF